MKKLKRWTLRAAYRTGVADGRMQEAYDRDSLEPVEHTAKEWFEEGVRRGFLWMSDV